ncbi:MAG: regulatory protein RecX [Panacagrimonas sp.]
MLRHPKKPEALTPADAQGSALRLLSRREHSAEQLKRKLTSRGHGEDAAEAVVERLAQAGWQSDERFAENLIRSRAAQGYGPLRIAAELEASGISDEPSRRALEALDCDFMAMAVNMHRKHFPGGDTPARGAEWQKQYRYLAGRGFTPEQIRAALSVETEPGE